MAITSWTSEGMDWSSANTIRLHGAYPYLPALYYASLERGRLFNAIFQNYWPIDKTEVTPLYIASEMTSVIRKITADIYRDYESAIDMDAWLDYFNAVSVKSVNPYGFMYSKISGQMVYQPAGYIERPYILDDRDESILTIKNLSPISAEWCYQAYRILNKLKTCQWPYMPYAIKPGKSKIYAKHCAGLSIYVFGARIIDGVSYLENVFKYISKTISDSDIDADGYCTVADGYENSSNYMQPLLAFISGLETFMYRDWEI